MVGEEVVGWFCIGVFWENQDTTTSTRIMGNKEIVVKSKILRTFSLYWSINWARTLEMALRIVDWIRVTVKGDGGIVLYVCIVFLWMVMDVQEVKSIMDFWGFMLVFFFFWKKGVDEICI